MCFCHINRDNEKWNCGKALKFYVFVFFFSHNCWLSLWVLKFVLFSGFFFFIILSWTTSGDSVNLLETFLIIIFPRTTDYIFSFEFVVPPFISEFKFFNQITSKQVWQPHENEYKGTFCFYSQTSNKMYDKINILRNQRTFLPQFSSNFFLSFLFFPTFHIFFFLWCVFVSHQNSKQVQGFQLSLSLNPKLSPPSPSLLIFIPPSPSHYISLYLYRALVGK